MAIARRSKFLAHRGNGAGAPENSLSAFVAIGGLGVDGVELDVQMTADERLVVLHDPSVDRTTNGRGAVIELQFDTLRSFRLHGTEGESIPTLREALEALSASQNERLEIAFDLKAPQEARSRLYRRFAVELDEMRANGIDLRERMWFQTQKEQAAHLRRHFPQARYCNLSRKGRDPVQYVEETRDGGFRYIEPAIDMITDEFVRRAHEANLEIIAPLNSRGNDPRLLPGLFGLSVDWILTDDPAEALGWERAMEPK